MVDIPVRPPGFIVEMRSDTNTVAQLFYDIGSGMNEADSVRLPVPASSAYRTLRFPLPNARIRALRFDPISGSGTFSVRHASVEDSFGFHRRKFASSDLTALHQIGSRTETESDITFATTPGAADPMLQVAVRRPIDFSPSNWHRVARVAIQLVACLFITGLTGSIYIVVRSRAAPIGAVLDRWARFVERSRIPGHRSFCDGLLPWHPDLVCALGGCRSSRVVDFTCTRPQRSSTHAPVHPNRGDREANSGRRMGVPHRRRFFTRSTVRRRSAARTTPWVPTTRRSSPTFRYGTSRQSSGRSSGVSSFCRRPMAFRSTGSSRRCCC